MMKEWIQLHLNDTINMPDFENYEKENKLKDWIQLHLNDTSNMPEFEYYDFENCHFQNRSKIDFT